MMRFLRLFDHPVLGRVFYGNQGTLTSDGRKVILIKYNDDCLQGFYQSSGLQSGFEGTWFPFDGDVTNSQTGEALLLKVSKTSFASQFKTFVKKTKEADVRHQRNMIKFGTALFLYTSYKLGGGLWDKPRERKRALDHLPSNIRSEDVESSFDMSRISFPRRAQSQKEVNLFLKNALSFNFLKGTEYPERWNGDWVLDYRDIYNDKVFEFYPNTRISFERSLLTRCPSSTTDEPILLDFMVEEDHNNTSFTNFFYPSIQGLSIFENAFCKKFRR